MKKIITLIAITLFIITGCSKDDDKSKDFLANTVWVATNSGETATLTFFKDNDFNIQTKGGTENLNISGSYVLNGKTVSFKPNDDNLDTINGVLNSNNSKMTVTGTEGMSIVFTKK